MRTESAKNGIASVPLLGRPAVDASPNGHDDPRLEAAIDAYLKACETGPPPEVEAFVQAHHDIADELRECLAGLMFLQQTAPNIESSSAGIIERFNAAAGPSDLLGDFRILREIGRGGMGIVYEAEQISLRRRVALKILPFAAVLDPRHLQRFKNEALAAASLDHPNIVEVHAVGCERGVHFYAMRYVEGQTLAAVILECGDSSPLSLSIDSASNGKVALSEKESDDKSSHSKDTVVAALSTLRTKNPRDFFRLVAELGIQAAEALDHAHNLGIVHRDIKPSNLSVAILLRKMQHLITLSVMTTLHRPLTTGH